MDSSTQGKTPWHTMNARLNTNTKRTDSDFIRVGRGNYTLKQNPHSLMRASMFEKSGINFSMSPTEEQIAAILQESLPEWKKTCDSDQAEGIILHQDAFGISTDEMLLLGFAVKYAGLKKKDIRIADGRS
mgnify:CR=1 FL=1